VPLEQKRALGNPGHQKLPDVQATHDVARIEAKPPRHLRLGPEGKRLWAHVADLPWVATSDAAALAEVCKDADLALALRADIAEHGVAYEVRGRVMPNPSLGRLENVAKRLTQGMSLFGLSPADRTRLGIAEVKAKSKLEELAERREARAQRHA